MVSKDSVVEDPCEKPEVRDPLPVVAQLVDPFRVLCHRTARFLLHSLN